ncbi:LysR family transcriptional regulator [Rhizobium aegyptiacum]|uniref:LysR family transcriptional regulator n=1 Tax=Rhizobium aegyptiacum TaxID=1764550 RepID=UPI00142E5295|nr:LysR family transcriptional regulator [Rhizobium aegyptiacum]
MTDKMQGANSMPPPSALDQSSWPLGIHTNYFLSSVNNRFMRITLAVAETGSMTMAGKRLHLSQSAVSKAIKEIEKRIGMPIFYPSGKTLLPTEAGSAYIQAARQVINNLRILEDSVQSLSRGMQGLVRIGVQSIAAQPLMVEAIAIMNDKCPDVRFQLTDLPIDQMVDQLSRNMLDFGLGRITPNILALGMNHLAMIEEPYCVIASNNNRLVFETSLDWAAVVAEHWCLPLPGTPIREKLSSMLVANNLTLPKAAIECNSLITTLMLHQQMNIISLAQGGVAQQWHRRGHIKILPLVISAKVAPMGLLWSKHFQRSPAAELFKRAVEDTLPNTSNIQANALWPQTL